MRYPPWYSGYGDQQSETVRISIYISRVIECGLYLLAGYTHSTKEVFLLHNQCKCCIFSEACGVMSSSDTIGCEYFYSIYTNELNDEKVERTIERNRDEFRDFWHTYLEEEFDF